MSTGRRQAIGLMTGTSMDGIDGVLLEERCEGQGGIAMHRVAAHHVPMPAELRAELLACQSPDARIDDMLRAQKSFTESLLPTLIALRDQADPTCLLGAGVHGQTVRHWPQEGISLQLLDPHLLAEATGLDIVSDFRRRDLAAGGQGAPLVPPFHAALLGNAPRPAAVLNIGGFANLSLVGSAAPVRGFDTGPGNVLMDAWIERCRGEAFDRDGAWAAQGEVHMPLLEQLLKHPDLQGTGPRSTGRDVFHLNWLLEGLQAIGWSEPLSPAQEASVQATLLELTCTTALRGLAESPQPCAAVYVCGGGARNLALMARLRETLAGLYTGDPTELHTTEALGWDPQEVEAAAFAWLALRHLAAEAGNAPTVTGARGPRRLGSLTPGRWPPQ